MVVVVFLALLISLSACLGGECPPVVLYTARAGGVEALDLLLCRAAMSQERRAPKHLHAVAQAVVALRWLLLG